MLSVVWALLFAESYLRWGHPIIDLGRDLYLPSQILAGRTLYRELLYNYGPTIPYMLAGITAVLGDALWVFEAFGIAIGLSAMAAVYAVGARLGGWAVGFGATLMFLVFSFFANSTWGCNFVLPYSYSATLGTAAALWSFYFLLRHLYGGRSTASMAWSVFFLFITLFSKHEIGLALGLVHALAWWAHKVPRKTIAIVIGLGLVSGLAFLSIFHARGPGEHALLAENILRYAGNMKDYFFHRVGGLDRPFDNIILTLKSLAQVTAIMLTAGVAGAAIPMARGKRWIPTALGTAAAVACAWLVWRFADVTIYQATLPLALALAVYFGVRDRRDPLLLLSVFVLLSALRIPLKFYPVWFGFYLFAPAFPLLVYALGPRLASWMPGRRVIVCALGALAVVTMLKFHRSTSESYGRMTSALSTPKGLMRDFPIGRAEAVADFLTYIDERFPGEKPSLVVFPQGVSLNYYTGMRNPTAYYLFVPAEVNSPELEARIIEELHAVQPDYIAFTSRYMKEFGVKGFGIDYGRGVAGWIDANYSRERVFRGPEGTAWRIVLMHRRDGR